MAVFLVHHAAVPPRPVLALCPSFGASVELHCYTSSDRQSVARSITDFSTYNL
jgi:hypothetical protein